MELTENMAPVRSAITPPISPPSVPPAAMRPRRGSHGRQGSGAGELLEDLQADDAGCGAFAQLGRLARHADEGATGLFARDRLGGPMRIVGRFEQVVRFDTVLMHGSAAGGGVATPSRPVCLRLTF